MVGKFSLGFSVFAFWPFVKKFGKRKTIIIGYIIAALGSAICLIDTHSMPVLLDYVEWKSGFRSDGLSGPVYSILTTVSK
ncbi:MAG: MFS transporter [Treponema sp.]|jgi:Na+/melibiose symporter-like transporter|nr:MFS transporter [Treponema sp.]